MTLAERRDAIEEAAREALHDWIRERPEPDDPPDAFETGEDDRHPGPLPGPAPRRGSCPECHVAPGCFHLTSCSRAEA